MGAISCHSGTAIDRHEGIGPCGEYVQNVTVTSCVETGSGVGKASRRRTNRSGSASADLAATDAKTPPEKRPTAESTSPSSNTPCAPFPPVLRSSGWPTPVSSVALVVQCSVCVSA